ncbi:hypothetical protein BSG1_17675 [Bacillus sp. SG-1]|nr:hypothetical protein BSG1_17675 [Bacillus sp. SG-1]
MNQILVRDDKIWTISAGDDQIPVQQKNWTNYKRKINQLQGLSYSLTTKIDPIPYTVSKLPIQKRGAIQ